MSTPVQNKNIHEEININNPAPDSARIKNGSLEQKIEANSKQIPDTKLNKREAQKSSKKNTKKLSVKTKKALSTVATIGETTGAILGLISIFIPLVAIGAAIASLIGVAANVGEKIVEHKH